MINIPNILPLKLTNIMTFIYIIQCTIVQGVSNRNIEVSRGQGIII